MSAREFEEWKVFFAQEQLHPFVERYRHAQLLQAAFQGAVGRRGGKPWALSDFLGVNPWVEAPKPPGRPAGTMAQQMRSLARGGRR